MTLGHEVCGAVTDFGPSVDEDWLGARVVCETFVFDLSVVRVVSGGATESLS